MHCRRSSQMSGNTLKKEETLQGGGADEHAVAVADL